MYVNMPTIGHRVEMLNDLAPPSRLSSVATLCILSVLPNGPTACTIGGRFQAAADSAGGSDMEWDQDGTDLMSELMGEVSDQQLCDLTCAVLVRVMVLRVLYFEIRRMWFS